MSLPCGSASLRPLNARRRSSTTSRAARAGGGGGLALRSWRKCVSGAGFGFLRGLAYERRAQSARPDAVPYSRTQSRTHQIGDGGHRYGYERHRTDSTDMMGSGVPQQSRVPLQQCRKADGRGTWAALSGSRKGGRLEGRRGRRGRGRGGGGGSIPSVRSFFGSHTPVSFS